MLAEAIKLKAPWPVWITKGKEMAKVLPMSNSGVPQVFAFDAKGKYVGTVIGFGGKGQQEEWEELLKRTMKGYKFPGTGSTK